MEWIRRHDTQVCSIELIEEIKPSDSSSEKQNAGARGPGRGGAPRPGADGPVRRDTQGGNHHRINPQATSGGDEIQKALDGLADGGEVVLAPGTYKIHQPIVLRHDYRTLREAGPETILVLADNANCPVVIIGAPSQPTPRTTEHLRLADLQIDGNRTNQQQELWRVACDGSVLNNNGVDIWAVNNAVVENVVCCRCRSGGLVAAQARRMEVRNYTAFDNEYDGLACYLTEESLFPACVCTTIWRQAFLSTWVSTTM